MLWGLVLRLGLATRPCSDGRCGDRSWHTADLTWLGLLSLQRWCP